MTYQSCCEIPESAFAGAPCLVRLIEGEQVTFLRAVPPPQSPVLPSQVQAQHVAVPVALFRAHLHHLDGLVRSFSQPVAGQGCAVVKAARGVEPLVFGYAGGGVVVPFSGVVLPSRAGGGYLQHEVRRLALVPDGIGSPVDRERPVHAEGRQEVGDAVTFRLPRGLPYRDFAQNDGRVAIAGAPAEGCLVGCPVQVKGVLHIVPGWELREFLRFPDVRRGSLLVMAVFVC